MITGIKTIFACSIAIESTLISDKAYQEIYAHSYHHDPCYEHDVDDLRFYILYFRPFIGNKVISSR